MRIELTTLGRLAVFADGRELTAITAQPIRAALLVYLAVERAVTRDAVLACIWPDQDPTASRHALSQTLYQLRQDLRNDWIDAAGAYLRAAPNLVADVMVFSEAVESGRHQDAIEVYGGPFLEGCHLAATTAFQNWMDRQRGRLARLHRKARRGCIEQAIAAGDVETALRVARDWVEIEPLEDEAQQYVIRLLADTGARAEALRRYADFSRLLDLEDLEPLPETKALADELRQADVPAQPSSPAGAERSVPPPTVPIASAPAEEKPSRRWTLLLAAAVVVVTAAAVLLGPLSPWRSLPAPRQEIGSLAVLPFENLTADSAEDYFVDGIHEALIADLTRVSDLRVISRTSVLRYQGTTLPIPEIARDLNVDAVIEGSVLRAGHSVRIQASLIDAATDHTLGTVTFVRDLQDVLSLLSEVARGIAGELAATTTRRQTQSESRSLVDPDAYEAYLRARYLMHDFRGDSWSEAVRFYEKALAIDTTFALAGAGLAETYFLFGFFRVEPRSQAWSRARQMALRALEQDDAVSAQRTPSWDLFSSTRIGTGMALRRSCFTRCDSTRTTRWLGTRMRTS